MIVNFQDDSKALTSIQLEFSDGYVTKMLGSNEDQANEVQYVYRPDDPKPVHEVRILKTTKQHPLVNDTRISKMSQQRKLQIGDPDYPRIAGLALLGKKGQILVRLDLLHPDIADVTDFTVRKGGKHT